MGDQVGHSFCEEVKSWKTHGVADCFYQSFNGKRQSHCHLRQARFQLDKVNLGFSTADDQLGGAICSLCGKDTVCVFAEWDW